MIDASNSKLGAGNNEISAVELDFRSELTMEAYPAVVAAAVSFDTMRE